MNPYLMRSSGVRHELEKRNAAFFGKQQVFGLRRFTLLVGRPLYRIVPVTAERHIDQALPGWRMADAERDIRFPDGPGSESMSHCGVSGIGLSHDEQPGCVFVKSMHDARPVGVRGIR